MSLSDIMENVMLKSLPEKKKKVNNNYLLCIPIGCYLD